MYSKTQIQQIKDEDPAGSHRNPLIKHESEIGRHDDQLEKNAGTFSHRIMMQPARPQTDMLQMKTNSDNINRLQMQSIGNAGLVIQPKLTIDRPGDQYEKQADRIAEKVVNGKDPVISREPESKGVQLQEEEEELLQPKSIAEQIIPLVQRQEEEEEEEELLQPKLLSAEHPILQRQEIEEKETPVSDKVEQEGGRIWFFLSHGIKITILEGIFGCLGLLRKLSEAPAREHITEAEKKRWDRRFFRKLSDTTPYRRYKEAGRSIIKFWIWLIDAARTVISSLNEYEDLKVSYYRRLNSLTPYYTQMANLDILWKQTPIQKGPWSSTCNVTSLAMVLNALGVRTTDFTGNKELLERLGEKFGYENFVDLTDARMPDFLQVVVVYRNFRGSVNGRNFNRLAENARRRSTTRSGLTSLNVQKEVALLFNVEEVHRGWIRSYGTSTLEPEEKIARYTPARYKRNVIRQITPWLNAGAQILVNRPGHYVRLEDVNEKGIIIDDPAGKGKNYSVSWNEANRAGYFRSYLVFNMK